MTVGREWVAESYALGAAPLTPLPFKLANKRPSFCRLQGVQDSASLFLTTVVPQLALHSLRKSLGMSMPRVPSQGVQGGLLRLTLC